ncbi:hypothetical protein VFC49_01720 [Thermococcus sp. SY098]|uniref:hypothetical protein n=1 Tax=Thermococcus sp. SY098 TaxID=3111325 RepID=UPI002D79A7B4|nr:hypothetical protein [Thermococcus sp. SY098]WRS52900.1 hypothetical protein VFC49_01720 [Thermococcus sp. SY098]
MLEGDPTPWKFREYHKKLSLLRATIGLATLAITYRHRDKDAFKSFADDVYAEHVTGRALIRVAKKKIHAFEGELDEKKLTWFIKKYPEGDAYIIPPPEEIFEDEEKIDKLAEGIKHEFYKKYDIILPKEDIVYALKKSYEITKKFLDVYDDLASGRIRDPSEGIRKHPAYKELIQFLKEFAGAKKKVKRPKALQKGKDVQKGSEGGDSLTVDILAMFQALKLLNYSEDAVSNTVKDLEKKIKSIAELDDPGPEDVYMLGLYYLALNYIREEKFEKAEEVFRNL